MTIQNVARHLGVGWDMIKEMQKEDLQRRFSKVRFKRVRQIAIDEITVGKERRYVTIVSQGSRRVRWPTKPARIAVRAYNATSCAL